MTSESTNQKPRLATWEREWRQSHDGHGPFPQANGRQTTPVEDTASRGGAHEPHTAGGEPDVTP
jgi:hypothetical protein